MGKTKSNGWVWIVNGQFATFVEVKAKIKKEYDKIKLCLSQRKIYIKSGLS